MKLDEFKVGQRIRKKEDEGDGPKWFYGEVKAISSEYVEIEWDDIP